ncbi:MAG: squalene/phytoene synthase family protein [Planctomycetota bacterium]
MAFSLIDDLLQKTSRTFALAIPLLPEPLQSEVGVGYLLFRIADTLEDAELLGRDERIAALQEWIELLEAPSATEAKRLANGWAKAPTSTNAEYNRLLRETPAVIARFLAFEDASRAAIAKHAARSARGMAETLSGSDAAGTLALATLEELREYCYFVAGIVGEMLTDLFELRLDASPSRDALAVDAAAFGEGLQLVNILKDAPDDARDGRTYLPPGVSRAEVIQLAHDNLAAAERYADHLQAAGADEGVLAFVTLPRTLAEATLDGLEHGERKVTRGVVAEKLAEAEAIRTGRAS